MVFLAIWGEGYHRLGAEAKVERVPLTFFTEENGYSEEEAGAFANLDVGDSCTNYQCGCHTVVRIG
ncbi:hypothetical protein [Geomonas subterranea]|uniref:hypothetical protein n=1 Tax=Geomonas subterranea TaxID=2847989 RepID=UPI001CD789AB|nr:hypothetical protein [Geomonas fuzhouensis]